MTQRTAAQKTPAARFEISDDLPTGIVLLPIERRGEVLWLVRRGHMTPELCESLNAHLTHITRHGLWEHNWGGSVEQTRPYASAC
ncbi:hypothetical protein [Streptomyces sp. NPDC093097]|uniref:hypothetical protein n=1 Tax=Streptomyces sp. NPDC093097 TaxID=3366027 RepID=UPI0038064EDC